jgi:hypothetical protein
MNKQIDAQNIDTVIETIGETGSAKLTAGGLYSRREENCDWMFEGAVEAEDCNDVLSALHAAGKLHGTWTPENASLS